MITTQRSFPRAPHRARALSSSQEERPSTDHEVIEDRERAQARVTHKPKARNAEQQQVEQQHADQNNEHRSRRTSQQRNGRGKLISAADALTNTSSGAGVDVALIECTT
jgi:hypothetical protein